MIQTEEKTGPVFKCSTGELAAVLRAVSGAVGRTTLPVLQNVLVDVGADGAKVTATSLDIWAFSELLTRSAAPGAVLMNYERLAEFISSLPEGDIEVTCKTGKAVVRSGRSRLSLTVSEASGFPAAPKLENTREFTVQAQELAAMLRATIRAMATDKARHLLNSVMWRSRDGKLELVSVDGRRMAQAFGSCAGPGEETRAIIPAQTVRELEASLGAIAKKAIVTIGPGSISVRCGGFEMLSKLVEGQFPDYERFIPERFEHVVVVDSTVLLSATKRAALCSDKLSRAVKITVSGGDSPQIVLEAATQVAESVEEVSCKYGGVGIQLFMDYALLRDALEALGEGEVRIGINAPMAPVVIEPEGNKSQRQLVMPMRG